MLERCWRDAGEVLGMGQGRSLRKGNHWMRACRGGLASVPFAPLPRSPCEHNAFNAAAQRPLNRPHTSAQPHPHRSTRYWPGTALGSWLLAAPDTAGAAAALLGTPLEALPASWVVAVLDPSRLAALTLNLPVPVQVGGHTAGRVQSQQGA